MYIKTEEQAVWSGKIYQRLNRTNTGCKCGCNSMDPWHLASYHRIIRDRRVITPTTVETCIDREFVATLEGVARFPWGKTRVVGKLIPLNGGRSLELWTIDYNNMLDVQHKTTKQ